jgi:hypothetical protein
MLCDLYASPNTIKVTNSRRIRLAWHVAHLAEKRNAYRVLVENLQGKPLLQRRRCNCEENIETCLKRERIG